MPPKKGAGKTTAHYKAGTQIKDIVPTSEKNQPREGKPLKQVEPVSQIPKMVLFEQFNDIEMWPGDEAAQNFDFQLNGTQTFQETTNIIKDYFEVKNSQDNIIFWRRPNDYIKDEQEEKNSFKQMITIRRRQSFQANKNMGLKYQGNSGDVEEFPQLLKDDTEAYRKNKQDFIDQDDNEQENNQQQKQQQKELVLKVFDVFEREETQEEMEQRLKEQELKAQDNKKAKKAPKKGEEQQEGPQKIKDVKLSNIDMSYDLINDCKWIASQLQFIKDRNVRDVYNNKPIWSKIYPQVDGVPVYNPTGKYWVKLYYMGKERKIEISDQMPVNVRGECYFPKSVKKEEIWAPLITKALLKLITLTSNIENSQNLTGSGLIMYALTGMLSENIPISMDDQKQNENTMQFVKNLLSDQNYQNNDVFVSCYCEPDFIPQAESNLKRDAKEYYIDKIRDGYGASNQKVLEEENEDDSVENQQQSQQHEESKQSSSTPKNSKKIHDFIPETIDSPAKNRSKIYMQRKTSLREKPTFIIPGFSYPIMEGFMNYNFNMVYIQKRSDKEVKLRQEYFDISKVTMHKFTKDEKLEHRRKKKELREKISECDRSRVELITKPPIQYKLFKLKTGASRCPQLNIQCPFTNDEIQIAKTCIANNLSKPPNYELPEIRDDGKSMISTVKNQDESFVMRPLDDFSSLSNLKKVLPRGQGGNWVQHNDFVGCFQYFQIFYNPQKLQNNKDILIESNSDYELTQNIENELLLVHQKQDENQNLLGDTIKLILGFQPKNAQKQILKPSPYLILQKFDLSSFDSVHDYPALRLKQQSQFLELENQNHVFRLMTYSPLSFLINIASDSTFETTSISNYLQTYEDYKLKQFNIEYPSFEENKYTNLFKFKINPYEQENTFILQINSNNDNNMLKYFRYKIIEQPKEDQKYMLETLEGVTKNMQEQVICMQDYLRITLKEQTQYFLILEGLVPYNVQEGTLECNFYLKHEEQQIEQVEQVEPVYYTDKYNPTKYGILFREKLYVAEQSVNSLHLRIGLTEGGAQVQQVADKKGGKKGDTGAEIVEKPYNEKRLIKIELFENNKLIQYNTGYNSTFLSNIVLKPTKDESVQYHLQATFDLRDWEGCKEVTEETQNIVWFLQVQSSDTLVIVKDTVKEDREKSIIKSWEENQPGRAAKSKIARQKYLLTLKQQNGEELNEEELALLKEQRLSKKQREEEQGGGANAKGGAKKATKKDDKKAAKKGGKVEEEVVKEQRPLPVSYNHRMNEIKEFLIHMEAERVSEVLADHQGLINIRSEENKKEIQENAKLSVQDLEGLLYRNKELREELNQIQNNQKEIISKQILKGSEEFKQVWEEYQQNREDIKNQLGEKQLKEKELNEIIGQEKPTITPEQFQKLIEESEQIPDVNKKLIDLSYQVLKNIKIFALNDKFKTALETFDIETLKTCMAEFNEFSVTGIDSEIIEQTDAMLQEAAENPNFQAEKAAELKKAGKKGKK